MRICRFDDNRIGVVEGDAVWDVTAITRRFPQTRWPHPYGDPLVACLDSERQTLLELKRGADPRPLSAVRLLSPVARPSRIIGLATSYREHAREAAMDAVLSQHLSDTPDGMRIFIKACPSLVGAGEGVALRFLDQRNDPELELAIVIGRTCDRVSAVDALDHVAGYTIGLDMTLRGAGPPSARKSIDTYSVLGPWIVTADELPDASDLMMKLAVNGDVRQHASTRDLLYSLVDIVSHVSNFFCLLPGDVIMTGTPGGVAPIRPGDIMTAEIAGIGAMTVAIRASGSAAIS